MNFQSDNFLLQSPTLNNDKNGEDEDCDVFPDFILDAIREISALSCLPTNVCT